MIDKTLINTINKLAVKEKKTREYKARLRVKGILLKKSQTKKGNLVLTVKDKKDEYKFTVLKSHKDKFQLAENLAPGRSLSLEGIRRLRTVICTRLKPLTKSLDMSVQSKLEFLQ